LKETYRARRGLPASETLARDFTHAGRTLLAVIGRAVGIMLAAWGTVCVPAHDRMRLERLARYAGRPPLATDRLSLLPDGRLLYRLKHRWRDGTTHVVYEPLELIERLAALVPPPRFNLTFPGAADGRSNAPISEVGPAP